MDKAEETLAILARAQAKLAAATAEAVVTTTTTSLVLVVVVLDHGGTAVDSSDPIQFKPGSGIRKLLGCALQCGPASP